MPERKSSVIIKDILNCISHIDQYTSGFSFDEFSKNFMAVEACLYNIQIIGEAVSQLPEEIKQKETYIPWILIKGMQNRLIHEYFKQISLLYRMSSKMNFLLLKLNWKEFNRNF